MRDGIGAVVKRVETLEASLAGNTEKIKKVSVGTFLSRVKGIPNFTEKVNHPDFQVFLGKAIPGTGGMTYAQNLKIAHDAENFEAVEDILSQFKLPDKTTELPSLPTSKASAVQSTEKPKLKFSQRKKVSEDFRKGLISKEKMEEFVKAYDLAEKEGRVDFTT